MMPFVEHIAGRPPPVGFGLHRRGIGRVRHIDVRDLWLQDEVRGKKVEVAKVRGEDNTADIGTKPLKAVGIARLMAQMRFRTPVS